MAVQRQGQIVNGRAEHGRAGQSRGRQGSEGQDRGRGMGRGRTLAIAMHGKGGAGHDRA